MKLSLQQTDKFTTGSLVTRLTNDINAVQDMVNMILRMFVRAPMQFIGGIIMAVAISPKFGIVLLAALPIQLILVFLMIKKATPLYTDGEARPRELGGSGERYRREGRQGLLQGGL